MRFWALEWRGGRRRDEWELTEASIAGMGGREECHDPGEWERGSRSERENNTTDLTKNRQETRSQLLIEQNNASKKQRNKAQETK